MPPHSLPLTLLGTGILWFGWFGFNAGSALAANGVAAQAFINTFVAASAAMLGWLIVERLKAGHATTLGAASGAVAGLVAITPCAGFVGAVPADHHRRPRRRGLLPGDPAEVPVRVRRLARRRRRAPRRRHDRLDPARPLRRRDRERRPAPTACSTAAGWSLFGEQVLAVAVVFAFSVGGHRRSSPTSSRSGCRTASVSRRRTKKSASTSPSTPRSATHSSGSDGGFVRQNWSSS